MWNWDNFRSGERSRVFVNAPPGLLYAGDPTFLRALGDARSVVEFFAARGRGLGRERQRADGAARVGALAYDFPTGDMQILQTSAAPFGNRVRVDLPPGGFDNPYSAIGGNPHPIATSRDTVFPPRHVRRHGARDQLTAFQSWNVTLERQMGTNWGSR